MRSVRFSLFQQSFIHVSVPAPPPVGTAGTGEWGAAAVSLRVESPSLSQPGAVLSLCLSVSLCLLPSVSLSRSLVA
jgi:hypothetical protein